MEIIEIKTERESFIFCSMFFLFVMSDVFGFSGGILGWDPVHTTCIFFEKSYKIS